MSWLRIEDGFADHPKIVELSDAAFRAHVGALCYAARNLTDGHIPGAIARSVSQGRKKVIDDLLEAGLWQPNGGKGFQIHDYLVYNETKDDVLERRSQVSKVRSKAGKKGAAARWQR